MPPLVIEDAELEAGLYILDEAMADTIGTQRTHAVAMPAQNQAGEQLGGK